MADIITIRRCPSFNKASGLAAEWYRHEHSDHPLSPSRAAEIAAHLLAASHAKRNGHAMPKDWKRAHPSLPYQYGGLAERIMETPLIKRANGLPAFFIETRAAKAAPSRARRKDALPCR